jgi:hypothetical protein
MIIMQEVGRLMVLMTHNTDVSDSWEREGEDPRYFYRFSVDVVPGSDERPHLCDDPLTQLASPLAAEYTFDIWAIRYGSS